MNEEKFAFTFDPRTKLFLLFTIVTGAMMAPNFYYQLIQVGLIALFALLAIMLRYLPSVKEDRRFIRDAMRLRGISGGFFAHPIRTVECIYVPMMMSASKTADELSIASVTRRIENPHPRTGLTQVKLRIQDYLILLIFFTYLILGLFHSEVFS